MAVWGQTIKALVAAAFVAAAGAEPVSAAVTFGNNVRVTVGANSSTLSADPSSGNVVFSWNGAPFAALVDFYSDLPFDLKLLNYTPSNPGTENSSGYILERLSGPNPGVLTTNTLFCNNTLLPPISNSCNLITGTGGPTSSAKPVSTLFANLAIGNYRLGFYESSQPAVGSATFQISTIPVPAALPLMLAGLAGLGFVAHRRRHSA